MRAGWAGVAAVLVVACGQGTGDPPVDPVGGPGPVDPGPGPIPIPGGDGPGAGGAPPGQLVEVFREPALRFLTVAPDGVAYAVDTGAAHRVLASTDGRTWEPRGAHPARSKLLVARALASGTLLADAAGPAGHALARSTDGGATWTDVLALGPYRLLTPGNLAELGGEVFLLEYQSFTGADVPITLWASDDDGATWEARLVTAEHRHGHGLVADPGRGALWLLFGDRTGGTYVSFDGGRTAALVRRPLEGGVLVNAVPSAAGILGGLDALNQPLWPDVVELSVGGASEARFRLPGPSYSFHALAGGKGYLAGAAREPTGDVYPPGDEDAHLFASPDGVAFREIWSCRRLPGAESAARADVFVQLASGEPVVETRNCEGFGPDGTGYAILAAPR